MPTNASILADYASGIGTQGTTLTIDGNNQSVGIGTTLPTSTLDVNGDVNVTGVITATAFYGDASNLTGIDTDNALYSETAGIATYATTAGIATYADVAGIATVSQGLTGNPSISVTDITSTGNVSIAGTLTYEDVTNVDSIGIITAQSGIDVTSGGINVTGVSTFQDNIHLLDNDRLQIGGSSGTVDGFELYHNGSISYISDQGTGALRVLCNQFRIRNTADLEEIAAFNQNGSVELYYDGTKKFQTTGFGVTVFGGVNVSGTSTIRGANFDGGSALREKFNIISGKLSDNQTINVDNGMVHFFTTAETGISTANIISTAGINTDLGTGDTMSVTIITTAASAGYSTCVNIEGNYNDVQWLGGIDPTAGGASGKDVYSLQIFKTGDNGAGVGTYTVLGAVNNFA